MLLAGNGFMNLSGSSFLMAQDTPNAFLQSNNTVQQNKNEPNLNNSETPHPFSFNYDIDQMSCCNTIPRIEKKSMEPGSIQVATIEGNITELIEDKNEKVNEHEEKKNDEIPPQDDVPSTTEVVQSNRKEEKMKKFKTPKELLTKGRKPLVHRSSL